MKTIEFSLSQKSVLSALKKLDKELAKMDALLDMACKKLADIGYRVAFDGFSAAIYDGNKEFEMRIDKVEDGYAIVAEGQCVLFLEFGAGAKYGYGHPEPQGFGPGTYPGKGYWNRPQGWWYWDEGWQHTYGNPPSMAFHNARNQMLADVERVMKEVFKT